MDKKRIEQIDLIVKALRSKNQKKVIEALRVIPHEGSPEMIRPLFELQKAGINSETKMLLEKIIFNLKDKEVVPAFIELLEDEEFYDHQPQILTSIWQSGLEVGDHLVFLTNLAINGSFMTVLEVTTIIENLEFANDEELTKAIQLMDKAVKIKSETQEILVSMRELLLEKLLG